MIVTRTVTEQTGVTVIVPATLFTSTIIDSQSSTLNLYYIYSTSYKYCIQVALTLHSFTLHDPHFTRGLYFCQMDSHYVMHYTISSLYTVKKPLSKY